MTGLGSTSDPRRPRRELACAHQTKSSDAARRVLRDGGACCGRERRRPGRCRRRHRRCCCRRGVAGERARPQVARPRTWAASGLTHKSNDVGTWAASPQRTRASLNNETARDIVHTSIGGSGVRIRVSNAFGTPPVTFTDAYIGPRDKGAAIVAGSNRQVTFAGSTWVTIPAGSEVLSDPLPIRLPPSGSCVSPYVPGAPARSRDTTSRRLRTMCPPPAITPPTRPAPRSRQRLTGGTGWTASNSPSRAASMPSPR